MKDERIEIRISKEVKEQLKMCAEYEKRTVSALLNIIIEEYLKVHCHM